MRYTLYEAYAFASVREELFQGDEPFRWFQNALMANPRAGGVIPGTHGARKVRWNDPRRSKGKRSGIRVIYYFHDEKDGFVCCGYTTRTFPISVRA